MTDANSDIEDALRVVVYGRFPPVENPKAESCAKLAALLDQNGFFVTTVGEKDSCVRITAGFHANRVLKLSSQSFIEASKGSDLVIFSSAGVIENIHRPIFRHKMIEIWRRFSFPMKALKSSKRIIFVLDEKSMSKVEFWLGISQAIVAKLFHPLRTKIIWKPTPYDVAQIFLGNKPEKTELRSLMDVCFRLAYEEINKHSRQTLSTLWLQNVVEKIEAAGDNLQTKTAMREALNICMRLQSSQRKLNEKIACGSGGFETKKISTANRQEYKNAHSDFILHYRLQDKYTAAKLVTDEEITDTYIHDKGLRNAVPPLPIPLNLLNVAFPDETKSKDDKFYFAIDWLNIANREEYNDLRPFDATGKKAFAATVLFDFARRSEDISFIPQKTIEYFAQNLANDENNISLMELIAATLCQVPASDNSTLQSPWNAQEIRAWFYENVCKTIPSFTIFSTLPDKYQLISNPIARVVGLLDGPSGLAQNSYMSINALRKLNLPLEERDTGQFYRPRIHTQDTKQILRSAVIHHTAPHHMPRFILAPELAGGDPVHFGFMLWELEKLPEAHIFAANLLDEIWTPSAFVQSQYVNALDREVINIGKSISLPDVPIGNLDHYGLKPEHKVFLVSFDYRSGTERKNPLAAVEAFLEAFKQSRDVFLIIKTTPIEENHWGDPNNQMGKIRQIANDNSQIILDERLLPYEEFLSLIRRADCIVSSHRAEGFGYLPAYALWYGKSVISTDYSGTRDFCRPETSYPVAFDLSHIDMPNTIFDIEGAQWADVDIAALANAMSEVINNPDEAQAKAVNGKLLLHTYYSPEMQAQRYLNRFKANGIVD